MQYSRDCITITSNNLFFHFQKHPHLRGENAMAELDPDGMLFGIEKVVLHIIQPRMDNVCAWEIDRAELEGKFLKNIRRAADRALHLVAHPEDLKEDFLERARNAIISLAQP